MSEPSITISGKAIKMRYPLLELDHIEDTKLYEVSRDPDDLEQLLIIETEGYV